MVNTKGVYSAFGIFYITVFGQETTKEKLLFSNNDHSYIARVCISIISIIITDLKLMTIIIESRSSCCSNVSFPFDFYNYFPPFLVSLFAIRENDSFWDIHLWCDILLSNRRCSFSIAVIYFQSYWYREVCRMLAAQLVLGKELSSDQITSLVIDTEWCSCCVATKPYYSTSKRDIFQIIAKRMFWDDLTRPSILFYWICRKMACSACRNCSSCKQWKNSCRLTHPSDHCLSVGMLLIPIGTLWMSYIIIIYTRMVHSNSIMIEFQWTLWVYILTKRIHSNSIKPTRNFLYEKYGCFFLEE